MVPLTGNPQKLFSHLFDERGHGTNSSQTFIVRMWHEESDTTTNAECHAVTQLNSLSDRSRVAQWWEYIVDFANASRLLTANLLAAYPELASRLASGKYANDPDTETAMKSLESCAAGFVLATGCPGAGKSTWATEICDAVSLRTP